MSLVSFCECDACSTYRCCCVNVPFGPGNPVGDGTFCHKCRGIKDEDCEDCEDYVHAKLDPTDVEECAKCADMRHASDMVDVLVRNASWSGPAEYDRVCQDCLDREEGARDHYWDQRMDEERDEGRR